MGFIRHERQGLVYHTAEGLGRADGVAHAFTTRLGGVSQGDLASLNLRSSAASGDSQGNVEENYRRLAAALGLPEQRMVLSKQVHGAEIRLVTAEDAGKGLWRPGDYEADGLMTQETDLPLVIFSADCIPVLLADPAHRAVAAVHAGWRGTAQGIVSRAVEEMGRAFGTRPADLLAAIGPGIGPCCFETRDDVPEAMVETMGGEAEPFLQRGTDRWTVDLKGLNARQLTLSGVPEKQIDICPFCTACHPELYWSHRRMGDRRGVQGAVVVIR